MTKVQFYDRADDRKLKFAVIVTKTNGHWVFCKHKDRNTLEVPEGTGSREKISWPPQSVNCMRKQVPSISALNRSAYTLSLHPEILMDRKPSVCCFMRM